MTYPMVHGTGTIGRSWSCLQGTAVLSQMLRAVMGVALSMGHTAMAICYAVAVSGLPRTGELLSLQKSHISLCATKGVATLDLGFTKGGIRRGQQESVVIHDTSVVLMLNCLLETLLPADRLAPLPTKFRSLFELHVRKLELHVSFLANRQHELGAS